MQITLKTTVGALPFLLCVGVLIPSICGAQTHVHWNTTDEVAEWGTLTPGVGASTGGSYVFDYVSTNGAAAAGSFAGAGEGPIDGFGGMQSLNFDAAGNFIYTGMGQMTHTDASTAIDLSAVGSSATLNGVAVYSGSFIGTSALTNHLYEIGLIGDNTGKRFGDGTDALWIAGVENSVYGSGLPGEQSSLVNIELFSDEVATDANPLDQNYTYSSMQNFTSDLLIDGFHVDRTTTAVNPAIHPSAHLLGVRFENVGNDMMEVEVSISEIVYADRNGGAILSQTALSQVTHTVEHNLSDLSALYPALGYFQNDSEGSASGVVWDWDEQYNVVIPEPGGGLLFMVGASSLALWRRRR